MPWSKNASEGFGLVIAAGDLAAAEIVSEVMDTRHMGTMTLIFDLTRGGGAVTAVVMEVDCAPAPTGPWGPVQNQDETPPDKVLVTATRTKASISSDLIWAFNLTEGGPSLGGPFLRIRLAPTAGVSGDVIDVHGYAEA